MMQRRLQRSFSSASVVLKYERTSRKNVFAPASGAANGRNQSSYRDSRPSSRNPRAHPLREYVYGKHAVHSALLAHKRKSFDRLILYNAKDTIRPVLELASKYGVKVLEKDSRQELDKLTNNGVHNGVVLETDPLTIPQIKDLGAAEAASGDYTVVEVDPVYSTTAEKKHAVVSKTKFPLGIYIDEVTDPHNAGAIIRSAYYLGADFIIFPDHTTARLGPVAAKTSAGALDLMKLFQVKNSLPFLNRVKKNGHWRLVAADSGATEQMLTEQEVGAALEKSPVLLVLGSEGVGIRASIRNICDNFVALNKRGPADPIVDSLNVSVACGVIVAKFLASK